MWGRVSGYEKLVTSEVTEEDYEWLFSLPITIGKVIRRRRALYRERSPISFIYFLAKNNLRAMSAGGTEANPLSRVSALAVREMELASKSGGSFKRFLKVEVRKEYLFLWWSFIKSVALVLMIAFVIWLGLLYRYQSSKWRRGAEGDISTFWPLNGHWLPWL